MMAEVTETTEETLTEEAEAADALEAPSVIRIREYSREEWERIAKLRDPDELMGGNTPWYTWEAFQSVASREQALEAYKAEARRERDRSSDQRGPAEDPPGNVA
jgi:antirestriction protein